MEQIEAMRERLKEQNAHIIERQQKKIEVVYKKEIAHK
jgi:hypothetical protein